jgi:hypothetical protein
MTPQRTRVEQLIALIVLIALVGLLVWMAGRYWGQA